MRKHRLFSLILALSMSLSLMFGMTVNASAFVSGDINAEATTEVVVEVDEPAAEVDEPVSEVEEPVEAQPLTPDGNGNIADDIVSGSKQFITVQTKNGNHFYLILDRDRDGDNAYMLSQIDEADLAEFIEKEELEVQTPVIPEPEIIMPEPEPDPMPEPEKKDSGNSVLSLLLLAAAGGGAFYYFKVYKPKSEKPKQPNVEDMEFEDDVEINEDEGERHSMSEPFVEDDFADDDT